jgi:cytosine deaminase
MTTAAEMETLYDMVTTHAARAMGVADFEMAVGHPAHLVVLEAPNVLEALREHAAPRFVVSHGQLIDRAQMQSVATNRVW